MSGPSTRSHRSSVRGLEVTLAELVELLKANKSVLVITGAGLSAASGIPTFRGGSDSVWSVTAAAQGRRSVFRRDPLRWYNEFFLKHFPMSFTRKTPNAGHEALAALAREFPELRVITQNIDGLHRDTVNVWPDPSRLIEAHGRLGLFKCIAETDKAKENVEGSDDEKEGEDRGGGEKGKTRNEDEDSPHDNVDDDDDDDDDCCPYSFDKEIKPGEFQEGVRATLEDDDAHTAAARGLGCSLTEIPRCPGCGEAASPMSLLFDEDYDSHRFYDFEKAEDWFKEADAVVFVGTSFAVTLTSLAIREAKRRSIPVFDFNVSVSLKSSPALDAKTILGRAEVTLPALARAAGVSIATGSAAAAGTATAVGVPAAVEGSSDSSSSNSSSSGSSADRSFPDAGAAVPAAVAAAGGEHEREGGEGKTPAASMASSDDSESPLGRRAREDSSGGGGGSTSSCGDSSGSDANPPQAEENAQKWGPKRAKSALNPASGCGRGANAAAVSPVVPLTTLAAAAAARVTFSGDAQEKAVWGGGAAYLLDPALETPLRKEQVRVDLAEAYSRKPHPDPEIEASIEVLWQEQLAKNPLLFNGSKFRLAGYSTEGDHTAVAAVANAAAVASDSTDSSEGRGGGRTTPPPPARSRSPTSPPTRKLRLRLGLTDYRTFRGTNWSPLAAKLAADSARDHPWLEAAYLSQKLGVGAVVETADGYLLSLCRSQGVAEGKGMMGAPGGHPEPEKLGLTAEVLRSLSTKTASSRRKMGQHAVDELFDSAVQEVVDETNVPRSALGEPLLSGVVRQGNSFGTPSAVFIIPCSLEGAEVSALYAKGAKEAFESTALRSIPASEIIAEGPTAWFAERGLTATPSFLGALELWRDYRVLVAGGV